MLALRLAARGYKMEHNVLEVAGRLAGIQIAIRMLDSNGDQLRRAQEGGSVGPMAADELEARFERIRPFVVDDQGDDDQLTRLRRAAGADITEKMKGVFMAEGVEAFIDGVQLIHNGLAQEEDQ